MPRTLSMLLIGLVFGGLVGFLLAAGYGITLDGHDHATDHGPAAAHDHGVGAVLLLNPAEAPTLDLTLHADPAGGWNVELLTTGFAFSPQHVSQAHVPGEGHAHLYVNGEKIARLYGPWVQLPPVKAGDVVAVGLYSNDHKSLAVGQKAIVATLTIP